MSSPRPGTWASVLAALVVLLGPLAGSTLAARTEDTTGLLRTTDQPEGRSIPVARIDGVDYLELSDVALVSRATKYWRPELGKMVLKVGDHRVTLTVGSPFAYVEQVGANLLAPVLWHEDRIFVPVRLLTHVLAPLLRERVQWIREARELRVVRGDANVAGLSWDLRGDGTIASLRTTERLAGQLAREGRRAIVRVPGARLPETLPPSIQGVGLIDSVTVTEDLAAAVFTFWLSAGAGAAELVPRTSPPRLELVVTGAAGPAGEAALPAPDFQPAVSLPLPRPVRIVVLDPGHGGSDEGASAGDRPVEKEVTLDIVKRTRERLVADGFRVLLTRDTDRFVAAEDRARIANEGDADVFLSVHANAWFDPDVSGFSVGVSSRPAGAAADPLELRRWGQRDTTAVRDSEILAELVSKRMESGTGRPNRGVHADRWAPLTGVSAAAAMVECGFLTNDDDRKRLGEPAFRDKVAAALATALHEYRNSLQADIDSAAAFVGEPGDAGEGEGP